MRRWVREHSLSLALVALYLVFQGLGLATGEWEGVAMWQGHADDTLGALLIVLCTKWFRERGSKESK